ncbi:sulfite exporter TauE/SafE family protein [Bradyrhizobium oligotrophicum S58]
MISAVQGVLGLVCGAMVGFSLGLVGGGGSVLAVPLMVYVVGVPEPHIAIGSSAIAVATNAAINLANHARGGTVIWPIAALFATAGIIGAFTGSLLGKMVDGQKLLALFALVMMVIAMLMLKTRARIGTPDVKMSMANIPAIVGFGLATGTLSGFFGIGGGFLIVPALMAATGMPIMNAVSSSLVAVTTFGLTTAASYAWSGLVAWDLAGLFIAGGVAGGLAGTRLARHLSERRGALNVVFSVVIAVVALYMLTRSLLHIWS